MKEAAYNATIIFYYNAKPNHTLKGLVEQINDWYITVHVVPKIEHFGTNIINAARFMAVKVNIDVDN